jgi:hypothetical protein
LNKININLRKKRLPLPVQKRKRAQTAAPELVPCTDYLRTSGEPFSGSPTSSAAHSFQGRCSGPREFPACQSAVSNDRGKSCLDVSL